MKKAGTWSKLLLVMSTFRFRKKTDYGLAMVGLVAGRDEGYMSAAEMQDQGLPRHFLVKIAQDLKKAGIIGSKEGRGGGYYLKVDPEETSLREVVEALEGPILTTECVVHQGECPFERSCPQKQAMIEMSEEIERVLEKYKISDIS